MGRFSLTQLGRAESRCEGILKSAQHVLSGVALTDERRQLLRSLQQALQRQPSVSALLDINAYNISDALHACLCASQYADLKRCRTLAADADAMQIVDQLRDVMDCDLVIIEVFGEQLQRPDRVLASAAVLGSKPVIFVSAEPCAALQEAETFLRGTWPSCDSYGALEVSVGWCTATTAGRWCVRWEGSCVCGWRPLRAHRWSLVSCHVVMVTALWASVCYVSVHSIDDLQS